jgi:hypothetical protein
MVDGPLRIGRHDTAGLMGSTGTKPLLTESAPSSPPETLPPPGKLMPFENRGRALTMARLRARQGSVERIGAHFGRWLPFADGALPVRALWEVPKLLLAWVASNPPVATGSP